MELTDVLVLGMPISCGELGIIYQPTIEELVGYGDYISIFYPFMVSKKLFAEEISTSVELEDYDLLFLINPDGSLMLNGNKNNSLLEDLVTSLKFLYRTDKVKLVFEEQRIEIDETINITRNNYKMLCDIVLQMSQKERLEKEEELHFKSKRKKALHEKIERYRAETRRRNAILLGDMINTLLINTVRGFSYQEIKQMTMWQLYNNYSQIMSIDNHEQMMKYKVSEKYNVEDEIKHWSKVNKMQRIII